MSRTITPETDDIRFLEISCPVWTLRLYQATGVIPAKDMLLYGEGLGLEDGVYANTVFIRIPFRLFDQAKLLPTDLYVDEFRRDKDVRDQAREAGLGARKAHWRGSYDLIGNVLYDGDIDFYASGVEVFAYSEEEGCAVLIEDCQPENRLDAEAINSAFQISYLAFAQRVEVPSAITDELALLMKALTETADIGAILEFANGKRSLSADQVRRIKLLMS